jgi:phosphatidylglycerol:prolipoprotein diacylglycerol transferase
MRSVLFTIPLDGQASLGPLGKVPVFGMGLLLGLWCLAGLALVVLTVRRGGWQALGMTVPAVWVAVAAAIFMAPEIAHSFPIYGYASMLILGLWASSSLAARRLRREGADGEIAIDAALWIFFSGIVGARLFYVIEYHAHFFGRDPDTGKQRTLAEMLWGLVNLPKGGLVLYGGLILTPLAYYVFCRMRRVRPLALADIAITSILVGVMFGRLGCLLHGCCYGGVTDVPWAITFPAKSVPFEALVARGLLSENAAQSLPLHPAQIYDAISALLLALLTWAYYPYRRRTGEVIALGWIAYPINRFLIEFLRSDEPAQFGTSLTIGQLVSLALIASGIAFFWSLRFWSSGRQPILVESTTSPARAPVSAPIRAAAAGPARVASR